MKFDMEVLAKMVAEQIKNGMELNSEVNRKENAIVVKENEDKYKTVKDGGPWAVDSKYYGKEICGFIFNPYMIRWHLQKQFEELIDEYGINITHAVDCAYTYMYSIEYTLEEVRKLAMLKERDTLAFDERKKLFDLQSCEKIFIDYVRKVIKLIDSKETEAIKKTKEGKQAYIRLSKLGRLKIGTIQNGRLTRTNEYIKLLEKFEDLIININNVPTYKELYNLMRDCIYIKLPKDEKKSYEFKDCFIKSGAYYSLKQKLMFDESMSFKGKKGRDAVLYLRDQLNDGSKEGYMFYAMYKEALGIA